MDRDSLYELEETVALIKRHRFSTVALQFPDDLLKDSFYVSGALQERLKETSVRICILADTTFGNCCVDEVAAAHVNADLIVHYGSSCLSKPSRISTWFVFDKNPLDIKDFLEKARSVFRKEDKIRVTHDAGYEHIIDELMSQFWREFPFSTCQPISKWHLRGSDEHENHLDSNSPQKPWRGIPVMEDHMMTKESTNVASSKSKDILLYIGNETKLLATMLMVSGSFLHNVHIYDPEKALFQTPNDSSSKWIMRRYYLVEKIKQANIIGILAGTLSVVQYLEIIEHIKMTLKKFGKKYYCFVVGKINVSKLANFPEVDVFVHVTCPRASLIDCKDYYKPIVTPFELAMALADDPSWISNYCTDFNSLVPLFKKLCEQVAQDNQTDTLLENEDALFSNGQMIPIMNDHQELSKLDLSPAGAFLLKKTFRGLEPRLEETSLSLAVEGRSGLAKGYANELYESRLTDSAEKNSGVL